MRSLRAGFTLVELMVATGVIMLLLVVLLQLTTQTAATWRYTTGKVEQFREARAAFEAMTSRLSQATLNTYWDYDNATAPTKYERRSELRFISGPVATLLPAKDQPQRVTHAVFFHAPLGVTSQEDAAYKGLENLLNAWGYFVELNDDSKNRPGFLTDELAAPRWRFRLMEFSQATENLAIYNFTSGKILNSTPPRPKSPNYFGMHWFQWPIRDQTGAVRTRAENIVALVITPRLAKQDELAFKKKNADPSETSSPLAPDYSYDSGPPTVAVRKKDARYRDGAVNPFNQLPPVVQLTMVAIDETSALRLRLDADSADVFGLAKKFRSTAKYRTDLELQASTADGLSLESELVAQKVGYRVFSSNVPIRAAKWSREQADPK